MLLMNIIPTVQTRVDCTSFATYLSTFVVKLVTRLVLTLSYCCHSINIATIQKLEHHPLSYCLVHCFQLLHLILIIESDTLFPHAINIRGQSVSQFLSNMTTSNTPTYNCQSFDNLFHDDNLTPFKVSLPNHPHND